MGPMPEATIPEKPRRQRGAKTGAGLEAARAKQPAALLDGAASPAASHTHQTPPGTPPARVYVGDCRELIPRIPECRNAAVDLIFADPPFNWSRAYDEWDDQMSHESYLEFTYKWLDLCVAALRPGGALWVNIPDDWAAEIAMHLKYNRDQSGRYLTSAGPRLTMVNWCIWHYRFGQNTTVRFINSKVHAFYFVKPGPDVVWNPDAVLEMSDRRAIYGDARTENKNDGMPAGMRVPMDVWYGQYWGRVQGNSKERRGNHDNQLPEVYLARVIHATSREGDVVMDPFLGSGTTGVVAHALGRKFIGCEYSARNAQSAFERMKLGPIRNIRETGQSTAIFEKRSGLAAYADRAAASPKPPRKPRGRPKAPK